MTPIGRVAADDDRPCGRRAASDSRRRMHRRRAEPALFEQPVAADQDGRAVRRRASAPRPGSAWKPLDWPSGVRRVSARVRDDGARRSDAPIALSSDAASRSTSVGRRAVERHHVDDAQRAVRQRAGLVEGDAADRRPAARDARRP